MISKKTKSLTQFLQQYLFTNLEYSLLCNESSVTSIWLKLSSSDVEDDIRPNLRLCSKLWLNSDLNNNIFLTWNNIYIISSSLIKIYVFVNCMLACYSWSNGWTEWAKFSLSENKAHGCIPGSVARAKFSTIFFLNVFFRIRNFFLLFLKFHAQGWALVFKIKNNNGWLGGYHS